MLLLGTFAFLMEAEERVSVLAKKELSEWASLLPVTSSSQIQDSTDTHSQRVSMLHSILLDEEKKLIP